jgi:hypothetical protein
MRLRRFALLIFMFLALLNARRLCVVLGQVNEVPQKSNVPPETAREMAELQKILIANPADPAALFSLPWATQPLATKQKQSSY